MKLPRCPSLLALMLLLVCPLSAAGSKDVTLVDFTYIARDPTTGQESRDKVFEYSFGDWDKGKARQIRDKGLLINHLGSSGGVGANKKLNFHGATKARLLFIIGNGNEALAFSFSLVDKDGTDAQFSIPLAGQPRGQPLIVTVDLTHPTKVEKPGTTDGLDLTKLKSWQIKGDFGAKPLEIMLSKITTAAE